MRKFLPEAHYETYEREVAASKSVQSVPPEKRDFFCPVVSHGGISR